MTPTEQDKELREKLTKLISQDGWVDIQEVDVDGQVNELFAIITDDRKRVELKARIDTVMSIDAMLRFENMPLHPVQAESLKQYLRQLEAQQDEL